MIPYDNIYSILIIIFISLLFFLYSYFKDFNRNLMLILNFILFPLVFRDQFEIFYAIILSSIWEFLLIKIMLYIRKKEHLNIFVTSVIVILSTLPLLLMKINEYHDNFIIFIGIGFLNLKSTAILLEIYDNLIENISFKEYFRFILFFPTISIGPIDRYRRFNKNFNYIYNKNEYLELSKYGVKKIMRGIIYKFIIGYFIYNYWLIKIPYRESFLSKIDFMYAYFLSLYFDFAGYSHMAIGISYIFGIKSPENFNNPLMSRNIKEFWNRWHMSLTSWLRDYVYNRFVYFSIRNGIIKNKTVISYLGFLIVFIIMGLIHGIKSQYIFYGLYHAFFYIITDYILSKKIMKNRENILINMLLIVININIVFFSILIFQNLI